MALIYKNDGILTANTFRVTNGVPNDPRHSVENFSDLNLYSTFIYEDVNASVWYDSMIVVCQGKDDASKAGVYYLTLDSGKSIEDISKYSGSELSLLGTYGYYKKTYAADGVTVTSRTWTTNDLGTWTKLATGDSLTQAVADLGPVFKFKGVAEAIDPDHTTLTIKKGSYKDSNNKSHDVICLGTCVDYEQVKHYAWGYLNDSGDPVELFWYAENSTTQLDRDKTEQTVKYIVYNGTIYFQDGDAQGGIYTWEDLDGQTVYSQLNTATFNIYSSSTITAESTAVANVSALSYYAYKFSAKSTSVTLESAITSGNAITATATGTDNNNGHVYQIGDKEYASNGLTWVELGSPQEDWIVL